MKRNLGSAAAFACVLVAAACGGSADLGGTTPPCTCPLPSSVGGLAHDAGLDDSSDAGGGAAFEAGGDAASDVGLDTSEAAIADAPPAVTYPPHCSDGIQDGTETDVDCGGDCMGCGLGQACVTSADCGLGPGCDAPHGGCACDAYSRLCVTNHCFDHTFDGNETAVDCGGGVCPACGPGLGCNVDTDCSATARGCDPTHGGCACDAVSGLCIYSHCFDHKMDYAETDVDCGGPCSPCVVGNACLGDADCAMQACDGISLKCVMNQCADHRKDGQESDVDCGGINCNSCPVGSHCNNNLDCAAGHVCNAMHVCQ
jgi:hypothetical protein